MKDISFVPLRVEPDEDMSSELLLTSQYGQELIESFVTFVSENNAISKAS